MTEPKVKTALRAPAWLGGIAVLAAMVCSILQWEVGLAVSLLCLAYAVSLVLVTGVGLGVADTMRSIRLRWAGHFAIAAVVGTSTEGVWLGNALCPDRKLCDPNWGEQAACPSADESGNSLAASRRERADRL
jgi:hypothetical protein